MDATTGTTTKHSISMPTEIATAVRERAGRRGFSSYVTEAVAHTLRREALAEILADMETEHGPVDEAEVDQILATLAP